MAKYIYLIFHFLIWFFLACVLLVLLDQAVIYFFPAVSRSTEDCAFLIGFIIAIIFAIYRAGYEYSIKVCPFRGRSRTNFPISGHDSFKASVNRVLDELEVKAPEHYREVLEYLPKAVYAPDVCDEYDCDGRSDGYFAIDGTGGYWYFLFAMLHETGHNVIHYRNQVYYTGEEAADNYANQVLLVLGYPEYRY